MQEKLGNLIKLTAGMILLIILSVESFTILQEFHFI